MDWPSLWFSIAEKNGESMKILSAKIDASQRAHWKVIDHTERDGSSAMTLLLHGPEAPAPEARQRDLPPPGIFKLIVGIFKHFRSRKQKTRWKNYDPCKVGTSPVLAWTLLNPALARALKDVAQKQHVSINTLMLLPLDRAVREKFGAGGISRWSLPVNMRGMRGIGNSGNLLSYLNISFATGINLQDLHNCIKAKFAEGNHWVNWTLMHAGKLFGTERIEDYFKRSYENPNPETGTFSNLGEWNSDLIRDGEAFIIAAPTSKITPVAVAAATVNGQLSIVLQIHPTLNPKPSDVPELLALWMHKLEQISGVPVGATKICTETFDRALHFVEHPAAQIDR